MFHSQTKNQLFADIRFSFLICSFFLIGLSSCNIIENLGKGKNSEVVNSNDLTEEERLIIENTYLNMKLQYLSIRHNHPKAIREDHFNTFWLEMTNVTAEKFNTEIVVTYEITNLGKEKILGMSGYGQVLKTGNKEITGCGTTGSRFGCDRMAVYQKDVGFSDVVIGRQKFELDDEIKKIDTLELMCKVNGENHFLTFNDVPLEWH